MKKISTLTIVLSFLFILSAIVNSQDIISSPRLKKIDLFNAGPEINSKMSDFSPSISGDGKTMIFNTRSNENSSYNIYISNLTNGKWSNATPLSEINSQYNDETPFISYDGKTIVFSSDRKGGNWPSETADGRRRITYDIYKSDKTNGIWSKPVHLSRNINSRKNESSPSLSRDKKTLYFTRWPFRYMKGAVIMKAILKGGQYSDTEKLPKSINSKNHETGFIPSHKNGEDSTFYFSSKRDGGYGEWDIYSVKLSDGKFTIPINLGSKINTQRNELFFNWAGDNIYFCTNKNGGMGSYDIYTSKKTNLVIKKKEIDLSVKKKEEPFKKVETSDKKEDTSDIDNINIDVDNKDKHNKDAELNAYKRKLNEEEIQSDKIEENFNIDNNSEKITKESEKTEIKFIINKSSNNRPASTRFKIYLRKNLNRNNSILRIINKMSNSDGTLSIFPKDDVNYITIKTRYGNYLPYSHTVKVEQGNKKTVPVKIMERNFFSQEIYFGYKSTYIRLKYYPYLHKIINYLRENENSRLYILGYTDHSGSWYYNKILSMKRAESIRNYFIKAGIKSYRFRIKGYGEKYSRLKKHYKIYNYRNRKVKFKIVLIEK